jgi:tight adherence protein B
MILAPLASAVIVGLLLAPRASRRAPRRPRVGPDSRIRVGIGQIAGRHLATLRDGRGREHASPDAVAAWCDDLARQLRHGATLRSALITTIPTDDPLERSTRPLRRRLDRGASVLQACDGWAGELDAGGAREADMLIAFATVAGAAALAGGGAAAPLHRFASSMRQRAADELERRAHSAQARMSARVMTIVPLALLALLFATDDEVRSAVLQPGGAIVVTIGLALNALGAWWMHRIVGTTTTGRVR